MEKALCCTLQPPLCVQTLSSTMHTAAITHVYTHGLPVRGHVHSERGAHAAGLRRTQPRAPGPSRAQQLLTASSAQRLRSLPRASRSHRVPGHSRPPGLYLAAGAGAGVAHGPPGTAGGAAWALASRTGDRSPPGRMAALFRLRLGGAGGGAPPGAAWGCGKAWLLRPRLHTVEHREGFWGANEP